MGGTERTKKQKKNTFTFRFLDDVTCCKSVYTITHMEHELTPSCLMWVYLIPDAKMGYLKYKQTWPPRDGLPNTEIKALSTKLICRVKSALNTKPFRFSTIIGANTCGKNFR